MDKFYVSNSSLNTSRACKRKFFLQKIWTQSSYDKSLAGEAGSAIHEAFFLFLARRAEGVKFDEAFDEGLAVLFNKYPWEMEFYSKATNARKYSTIFYAYEQLCRSEFANRYRLVKLYDADNNPHWSTEIGFEIELQGITVKDKPLYYMGYIDLLVYDMLLKSHVGVDLKTTASNDVDEATFWHDSQMTGYGLPLSQALGQSPAEFDVGYLIQRLDLESEPQFHKMQKDMDDIRDWVHLLVREAKFIEECYAKDWWPKTLNSCNSYGSTCKWFSACKQSSFANTKAVTKQTLKEVTPDHMREFNPLISISIDTKVVN